MQTELIEGKGIGGIWQKTETVQIKTQLCLVRIFRRIQETWGIFQSPGLHQKITNYKSCENPEESKIIILSFQWELIFVPSSF